MNRSWVLADSSVWVNFLADQVNEATDALARLLDENRLATNDVVRTEVLTGAKNEAQYDFLSDRWDSLHYLPLSSPVWNRTTRLRYELARKGRMIPLPDVVIACSAIEADCELLHADRHFDRLGQLAPLKIFPFKK